MHRRFVMGVALLACAASGCFDFASLRGAGSDDGAAPFSPTDLAATTNDLIPRDGGSADLANTNPASDLSTAADLSAPAPDLTKGAADLTSTPPDLTPPPPDLYGCPFACANKGAPGHVCIDQHCGCNVAADCNPDVGDTCVNTVCLCDGKVACGGNRDCARHMCLLTGGEPCMSNGQCASNLCIGGFCN